MFRLNLLFVAIALTFFLTLAAPANGQYSLVRRARVETVDGVIFTVTVGPPLVISGKAVALHYSVRNNSSQAIYLVHENPTQFDTEKDSILVQAPIPIPVGHGGYDYSFTKIDRGKVYKSTIFIPSKIYAKESFWPIDVGFGYVTNVTGLNRRLRQDEDPANLRGLLYTRIKTIVVGKLSVKITE